MVERRILITTRLGLHARAAAKLVRVASSFQSQIRLWRVDGPGSADVGADAKSILSVLMLAASRGTELHASAKGIDEEAAINAIDQFFAEGFGEGEPESSR
jgi:phosphotransferase system HPr (HPr) family protein